MTSPFDCPAYKLFVGELGQCCSVSGSSPSQPEWQLTAGRRQLALRVVWLQGRVSTVAADGDEAVVDDGTGSARVFGCTKIPGGSDWLQPGCYCMVVGELSGTRPPELVAIKITPLADIHRELWKLEVEHARRHLASVAVG